MFNPCCLILLYPIAWVLLEPLRLCYKLLPVRHLGYSKYWRYCNDLTMHTLAYLRGCNVFIVIISRDFFGVLSLPGLWVEISRACIIVHVCLMWCLPWDASRIRTRSCVVYYRYVLSRTDFILLTWQICLIVNKIICQFLW